MGCGFLESVYQECLVIEFARSGIPFKAKSPIRLYYREVQLKQEYIPDFVCFDKIVIEIKAVEHLNDRHRAQVFNYLKGGRHHLGLLINFGHFPKVEYQRIAFG